MLHAVIMSGGSGTRFWPRSRTSRPKQLLALHGERSLLQQTVDRVAEAIPDERIVVVTNRAQAAETRRQLPQLPRENILIEPFGRDTAPCIGLAAGLIAARDPEACLAVLPADHLIEPKERFNALLQRGAEAAETGLIVTLGAPPDRPATGFGYIERGAQSADFPGLYEVSSFKEKPDQKTAEAYLEAGRFLWNCGIFIWRADTILEQLSASKPRIAEGIARLVAAAGGSDFDRRLEAEYEAFEKISIDYAVLERAERIAVIAIDFEWDDLGSWLAVEKLHAPDPQGHRVIDVDHLGIDSKNCFVAGDGRLIATVGVEDLIIVQTGDATLICRRDRAEDVKAVVEALKSQGKTALLD
jgi:mannose-1-phosphate guanylyltransferase